MKAKIPAKEPSWLGEVALRTVNAALVTSVGNPANSFFTKTLNFSVSDPKALGRIGLPSRYPSVGQKLPSTFKRGEITQSGCPVFAPAKCRKQDLCQA